MSFYTKAGSPRNSIVAHLHGSNTCTGAGIAASGAAPVLVLCRQLLAAGIDPDTALEVYRNGIVALRVRSLGEGAQLAVEDRPNGGKPPRFVPYRPMPNRAEGSPPITWRERTASLPWTEAAE